MNDRADKSNWLQSTLYKELTAILGWLRRLKCCLSKNWLLFLEILLMILICVLHGISAGHYADFYPINGTFQNFNPVRRLLAGQVPYKDFIDYLGMGHLYIGSMMSVVFGCHYQGSLIAFSFLTFFGLAALSLIIGKAVLKKMDLAVIITNLILLMLVIQPLFYVNAIGLVDDVKNALNSALGVGNSARFVRGIILPLSVALFFVGEKIYESYGEKFNERCRKLLPSVGTGIIAGFSFMWSKDYGISCWVCLAIMTFWVSLIYNRKVFLALIDLSAEIITSMVSLFVFVEIFTLGHFRQWIKEMFDTGGYQSWYYNSAKSYYFYDVDFSYLMLIQAFLAVTYLAFLFFRGIKKETLERYGVPGFVNMVSFCTVNEYKLLSGNSCREVALAALFLTLVFEMICLFKENQILYRIFLVTSILFGSSWLMATMKDEVVFQYMTDKAGRYLESMGGNVATLPDDLERTSEFLDGDRFWSTYASAQEVIEGKFQPSGTDYIIHVLGDGQRNKYMSKFQEGNFKYVATIRKSFTDWEYWIERANWFFYRELYRDWHPVFLNTYEIYWERNAVGEMHRIIGTYEVQVVEIDDSTKKLIIQTDETVNGMAEVLIDYSVKKKQNDRSAKMLFQSLLNVANTGTISASDGVYESNCLRNEGTEYVPMPITNGYGELTLTARPDKSVYLELKEASCKNIYTVMAELQ